MMEGGDNYPIPRSMSTSALREQLPSTAFRSHRAGYNRVALRPVEQTAAAWLIENATNETTLELLDSLLSSTTRETRGQMGCLSKLGKISGSFASHITLLGQEYARVSFPKDEPSCARLKQLLENTGSSYNLLNTNTILCCNKKDILIPYNPALEQAVTRYTQARLAGRAQPCAVL